MKIAKSQDNYLNIITSLVYSAITHTEGVAFDEVFYNKKNKNAGNVSVFFEESELIIDVNINVVFGYSVSGVSCALQEKIIADVKENTGLSVKKVNIIVNQVLFS